MDEKELCRLAVKARAHAYAPYSNYRVGAALLAQSGKVYTGCNIENAAYSATVCAERTALFSAVAAGERAFQMLAVAGGAGEEPSLAPPCGVCRQALSEFCAPDFPILLVSDAGRFVRCTLAALLPLCFGGEQLCGTNAAGEKTT